MIERETAVEIVVSGAGVLLFLVAVIGVSVTYGGNLAGTGALALVGAVVLFVLFMAIVGYYLASRD